MTSSTEAVALSDLPVFDEWDSPDFGLDFDWVTDDLYRRPYQGLLRGTDGSLVAYRHSDVRALATSKDVTHQSIESMSGLWQETAGTDADGITDLFGMTTFSLRSPEHLPNKKLASRRLTTERVRRFIDGMTEGVEAHIERVAGEGEIDFIPDFARPVAAEFWVRTMGVTPEESKDLLDIVPGLALSVVLAPTAEQLATASGAAERYLEILPRAVQRAIDADNPFVSGLVEDFNSLGNLAHWDDAATGFAIALIDGFGTLGSMIASAAFSLFSNPGPLSELRSDPSLVPLAFAEAARIHAAVTFTQREAARDFVYEGVEVPAGTAITQAWLFANRDPDVFPDPMEYRLQRESRSKQLTFGGGLYACVGRHVARIYGETVLRALSAQGVEIEFLGDATWSSGTALHEIMSMPVSLKRSG